MCALECKVTKPMCVVRCTGKSDDLNGFIKANAMLSQLKLRSHEDLKDHLAKTPQQQLDAAEEAAQAAITSYAEENARGMEGVQKKIIGEQKAILTKISKLFKRSSGLAVMAKASRFSAVDQLPERTASPQDRRSPRLSGNTTAEAGAAEASAAPAPAKRLTLSRVPGTMTFALATQPPAQPPAQTVNLAADMDALARKYPRRAVAAPKAMNPNSNNTRGARMAAATSCAPAASPAVAAAVAPAAAAGRSKQTSAAALNEIREQTKKKLLARLAKQQSMPEQVDKEEEEPPAPRASRSRAKKTVNFDVADDEAQVPDSEAGTTQPTAAQRRLLRNVVRAEDIMEEESEEGDERDEEQMDERPIAEESDGEAGDAPSLVPKPKKARKGGKHNQLEMSSMVNHNRKRLPAAPATALPVAAKPTQPAAVTAKDSTDVDIVNPEKARPKASIPADERPKYGPGSRGGEGARGGAGSYNTSKKRLESKLTQLKQLVEEGNTSDKTIEAARALTTTMPAGSIPEELSAALAATTSTDDAENIQELKKTVESMAEQVKSLTQANEALLNEKQELSLSSAKAMGELTAVKEQNARLEEQLRAKADEYARGMAAGVQATMQNLSLPRPM